MKSTILLNTPLGCDKKSVFVLLLINNHFEKEPSFAFHNNVQRVILSCCFAHHVTFQKNTPPIGLDEPWDALRYFKITVLQDYIL